MAFHHSKNNVGGRGRRQSAIHCSLKRQRPNEPRARDRKNQVRQRSLDPLQAPTAPGSKQLDSSPRPRDQVFCKLVILTEAASTLGALEAQVLVVAPGSFLFSRVIWLLINNCKRSAPAKPSLCDRHGQTRRFLHRRWDKTVDLQGQIQGADP